MLQEDRDMDLSTLLGQLGVGNMPTCRALDFAVRAECCVCTSDSASQVSYLLPQHPWSMVDMEDMAMNWESSRLDAW